MSDPHDRRLIEDYLPIKAISKEASREKSIRKGHISTLHLWWARRPLVACRAAVYGALVPADQFQPKNGPPEKRESLGRANAAKFITELCRYPGSPRVIAQAQEHILEAHAGRLSKELEDYSTGKAARPTWLDEFNWPKDKATVTREDIEAGRAPRPRVLDMFAGGGSIPLEALRLGCEAYALDLNPVAYIIELCTLVYPQKYGKPDPKAPGMTGPPRPGRPSHEMAGPPRPGRPSHETTWGGLAEEVRYWGNWVLEKVKAEIGDLYPPLPDLDWWDRLPACQTRTPSPSQLPMFPSVKRDVAKTRRKLPHWEKEGACYFVTYRVADGLQLTDQARDIVLDNLLHWSGERYDLWQAVVMADHVHMLLSPLPKAECRAGSPTYWTLSEILHTAKSYTANQINKAMGRSGPVWQDERFDHIVRSPASFEEKWHYIRQNPCKRGLVSKPEDYRWLYEDVGLAARPTLTPVAYLWTRTVRCKNPACGATVPLVRQTWLCKKKGGKKSPGRYVALKMVAQAASLGEMERAGRRPVPQEKKVRFEVVEATTQEALGFDPSIGSKGGNAICPFCGTVADINYVKDEGWKGRMGRQMMAIVCTRPGARGKIYLSADDYPDCLPDDEAIRKRIEGLCQRTALTVPSEPIANLPDDCRDNTLGIRVRPYGLRSWGDLFTPRQMLCLLTFAAAVREAVGQAASLSAASLSADKERAKAVGTYLAISLDKVADLDCTLTQWKPDAELCVHAFGRQALPMVWDFAEQVLYSGIGGSWQSQVSRTLEALNDTWHVPRSATLTRGSATALAWPDSSFDAVITDPPYYDNVPYADISDFFYVWLKRTVGHLYPEHFATEVTPKKSEAVADANRHGGSKDKARRAYEEMMVQSFAEAHRVLKPGGQMVVVYAHKTTLGWSTLVDALRQAGFTVTEAWPLNTEMGARLRAMESAALASSIFLVARKRGSGSLPDDDHDKQPASDSLAGCPTGSYEEQLQPELERNLRASDSLAGCPTGSYEQEVRPELERIVRERVDSLWKMGISGADLVIAAVGAGLRAFTRFARVEYANGEEVPTEKFLAEVEGVVLETLLEKIFGTASSGVATVDGPTRFYVLWRYTYGAGQVDAGEAIVFSYGQPVELDGPDGLSVGRAASPALLEKKKGKYRLRDFTERGHHEKLGLPVGGAADPSAGWQPAPLIDVLHRILWLIENRPRELNDFLEQARPDRERLRLVANALAGPALSGKTEEEAATLLTTTAPEQAALKKLIQNWHNLIERQLDMGPLFEKGR